MKGEVFISPGIAFIIKFFIRFFFFGVFGGGVVALMND
jgi:hypothetical protein